MRYLIFFLLVFANRSICSYSDSEIEDLLLSLSDPFNPSFEDYRQIELYFLFGERPYLSNMTKRSDLAHRMLQLRNFKLVGPNGEMPIFELYACHVRENTKDRCILIYGSYNPKYPERTLHLLEQIKTCGYSGYVMLRIGGIPDISHGGARLCTIPYTWRVNFFKEAVRRGFTKILYLDAILPPSSDLEMAFEIIDNYGLFAYSIPVDWIDNTYVGYIQHLGIPLEQMNQIPWFDGHAVGLNFTNDKICQLFQKWDEEMHTLEGFCTIGDDVPFTCLAWSFGFSPLKAIQGSQQQLKLLPHFFWDPPTPIDLIETR